MGEVLIVIGAFVAIILIGSASMIITAKWIDKRDCKALPRAIKQARKRLCEVVTDENHGGSRHSQGNLSCPICMGELYQRPTSSATPDTPSASNARDDVDQKASSQAENTQPAPVPSWSADDVVGLKACHHMFHERCLTTWFMMKRFDCPVCRTVYWDDDGKGTKRKTPASREATASQWAGIIV